SAPVRRRNAVLPSLIWLSMTPPSHVEADAEGDRCLFTGPPSAEYRAKGRFDDDSQFLTLFLRRRSSCSSWEIDSESNISFAIERKGGEFNSDAQSKESAVCYLPRAPTAPMVGGAFNSLRRVRRSS